MAKQTLVHLTLEQYQARYTADLQSWESQAFSRLFDVQAITPKAVQTTNQINTGEVLDAIARPLWSMEQMNQLLRLAPHVGKVYFSDFYTSGLDALAYSRSDFKAAAFCWAQTFDQYDFTRALFTNWMRPWEIMAFEIYSRVYVACEELKDLIVTALPHVAEKVKVTGLPYNHRHVFGKLRSLPTSREFDVVYAARWDKEKQPGQFLDLIQETNLKAVVCTGSEFLRGTDFEAISRANDMQAKGKLRILTNLDRATYFQVLSSSNTIFNCGLQDWISFTLLDALTFGCMPLYPAHRSFPRALFWQEEFLYSPGDIEQAAQKITTLITTRPPVFSMLSARVLQDHDNALNIIAEDLNGL